MNLSMYASPKLYSLAMRLLYWPHFDTRYRVVADLVPEGARVVDACCGDAYLYIEYLRKKNVRYIGLDNSPAMVRAGKERGLDIRLWNALHDDVPEADVVIIQGALCHFMKDAARVVTRLQGAAKEMLIVSEPIRPKEDSDNPLLSTITKTFTRPLNVDLEYQGERFTEAQLRALLSAQPGFISGTIIPGGREMLGVLRGAAVYSE